MKKTNLKKVLYDPYIIASVIIGVILLTLTLIFRVNPVEGAVVSEAVRGTLFHNLLLYTTMPAWIAGMVVGFSTFLAYPLMFLFQIALFSISGLIFRLIIKGICRTFQLTKDTED